jgi:hypothetical protein
MEEVAFELVLLGWVLVLLGALVCPQGSDALHFCLLVLQEVHEAVQGF